MQQGRPIAFYNKVLGPRSLGYYTYEKELLAIISAVMEWHSYMLGNPFIIHTDQQSIEFFMD